MFFKVAGKNVHLPKLIGAFILVAAVLMFIKASAVMTDSWDTVKFINKDCLTTPDKYSFDDCGKIASSMDITLRPDQAKLTQNQIWSSLFGPIASMFFWVAILVIGLVIYKTGDLVIPIEETIKELPVKKKKKG